MADLNNILDEMVGSMPGVSERIEDDSDIDTPDSSDDVSNRPSVTNIRRDKKGNVFDSTIHSMDEAGNPKYNASGTFSKKRGRKANPTIVETNVGNEAAENVARTQALQAGRASSELVFMIGKIIGGDEWSPIINPEYGLNEPEQMTDAFAAYYLATGKTEMSPWLGLAVCLSTYTLLRMRMPKTKKRMYTVVTWIKSKLKRKNNGS